MFDTLRVDIRRYIVTENVTNLRQTINMFLFTPALWVIVSYRFGRWVRSELKIPLVKQLLKILTKILHQLLCLITGIQIGFDADIGKGVYIGHWGMLVINSRVVIGSYCNIGAGAVIGQGGRGENRGCPIIGDFVFIGVGAKIFGKIHVGDGSAIGANAVITRDVPCNATVVGVPGKVINLLGSKGFIEY